MGTFTIFYNFLINSEYVGALKRTSHRIGYLQLLNRRLEGIIKKGGISRYMAIRDLIVNGDFESGTLSPWIILNASTTVTFSHSGYFSAQLFGGDLNSFIGQFVPASAGQSFELIVSLSKIGVNPSPPVTIQVTYFDSLFNFLGFGKLTNIATERVPNVENNVTWLEVYQTTSPAPAGTTQAFVLINKLPLTGSADILVDDVSLLLSEAMGSPGPTGPTGPTGVTG
ncbi:hypothetical protein B5V88_13475, partial [Heyndrickxia sporothermodurans]